MRSKSNVDDEHTDGGDDSTGVELRAVRSRELELRRARGEIACAECRRLKLKCDKKLPCTPCKRRRCQDTCPMGVGGRSRKSKGYSQPVGVPISQFFISAPPPFKTALDTNTFNALLVKLKEKNARIAALEAALQTECVEHQTLKRAMKSRKAQEGSREAGGFDEDEGKSRVSISEELYPRHGDSTDRFFAPTHPLLSPDLLDIKEDMEDQNFLQKQFSTGDEGLMKNAGNESMDLLSSFGTLSINDGQTVRFLGTSVTDENVSLERNTSRHTKLSGTKNLLSGDPSIGLASNIAQAGALWPFAPAHLTASELAVQIAAQLPSFERATALAEAYFTNISTLRNAIDRTQLNSELFPLFYPPSAQRIIHTSSLVHAAAERPHDLALLFALFCCGAVADLTESPLNHEAARYSVLARAALGLQSIFEESSLSACQTIFLLGTYEGHLGLGSVESAWKLTSLALNLASSIGLHRDAERWNLDSTIVERRRLVFWEFYFADNLRGMSTGRPTAFRANEIDVKLPTNLEKYVNDDGVEMYSAQEWRYRFARDVLHHISTRLCSAHPIKYSVILELDRRVRSFEMHPYLKQLVPGSKANPEPELPGKSPVSTAWHRELALLFIHRNLFTRAMIDFPQDPLRSPLAPSVIAAYHSASCILRILRAADRYPVSLIMSRLWPVWSQALSCAVILATVAAKGRIISFSMSAFQELEKILELFENMSTQPMVKHRLPLLRRLRDRAHAVLFDERSSHQPQQNLDGEEGGSSVQSHFTDVDDFSTEELLLVLRGAAHITPAPLRHDELDGSRSKTTIAPTEHNQAPLGMPLQDANSSPSNASTGSSDYHRSVGPTTPQPVIVSSNLFQDTILGQSTENRREKQAAANSLAVSQGQQPPYTQQQRGETDFPSQEPQQPTEDIGHYSQAWLGFEPATGLVQGQTNPNAPSQVGYDSFSLNNSEDFNSLLFRTSHLSAAELDSIMSYPITMTPSVEPGLGTVGGGGANSMPGLSMSADLNDVEWSALMQLPEITGSGAAPGMDWEVQPYFSR